MWKRVVAPTILISLMWISVSVVTTYHINWLCEAHTRVLSENVTTIQAVGAMQDILWRLQVAGLEVAGPGRPAAASQIAELEGAFEENLQKAEKTAVQPEEQVLVKAIREQFALYGDHLHHRLESREVEDARPSSFDEMMALARAVAQPCKQLLELNDRLMSESLVASNQTVSLVTLIRVVFLVAGPAIGILCGFWVARGLHRSLSQISVTLKGATGELLEEIGRVDVYAPDDLPALQQQVQAIASRIKQVGEELQQARREAMRAERLAAVGELAASVAHELRNPLTSVKLLIQNTVQRRTDRPLGDKPFRVVLEEISRMENTIQGLLDFARPSQLNRVAHDLGNTVRRALNLVEGRAKQEGVAVSEDLPDGPILVDGDPEQLHQVFVNLLLNSIESMRDGGSLRVCVSSQPARGGCRVSFTDSGTGIPEELAERIFEPFVTSKEYGTGLGLAISRRIVETHGGTIAATNGPQQGAVFTVDLPLCSTSCRLSDSALVRRQAASSEPESPEDSTDA
jgi:signal transduction histidine kinase